MNKAIAFALVLALALAGTTQAALNGDFAADNCNGNADTNCECKEDQGNCDKGEHCTLFVVDWCQIG